jgi:4-hydroxybenzoate polyprenyltransferase
VTGWLGALLRCASCRFAAQYWMCFSVAAGAGGGPRAGWWLAAAAPCWFAFSMGTELLNRLADRTEDRVNRPERTALCRRVGWSRLRVLMAAIFVALAGADLALTLMARDLVLGLLLGLGLLFAVNYSVGLRFKRWRLFSLFVLTFPFAGTFVCGLATHAAPLDAAGFVAGVVREHGGVLLVGGLFIVTLAGTKDITDLRGDELAGYRSLFAALVQRGRTGLLYAAVMIPFGACLALVAAGALPLRFVLLLVLAPVSLAIALCVARASTAAQRAATREVFHQYWMVFIGATLLLAEPTALTAAVVAAGETYWLLASFTLHWAPGPGRACLAAVAEVLRQPALTPAARRSAEP